ncbi:MAG: ribosome recycling factor [Candidatus Harrisonbacteria bacterium CG10_big_fil_rev_8_21_14_0_10_49_15]|uniref:Ribosome recycling factor n=1 Tax=Candidatus Harrisonbacteria bacterium CG10_big_fil_rev_8_21_14_0_10_49_15 TaxID=1974587 RepID=A0A2H0ULN7_9BACT|nr:MAG: ribosome recycling factor [Candidatus Harrisonbacteria bacterium CG10_big_fil_rev_8_21_14_0_10_49_15]
MEKIVSELDRRAQAALNAFREELSSIRGNQPSPALVEDLKIEYFEQQVPLKQLGAISMVPPRELVVTLWDPSNIETVAKAINDAKRGFSASVRGTSIHIILPQLTQERREELIKLTKQIGEKYRIEFRNFRDDAKRRLESAEAAKEITEDQEFKGMKKVQEAIDGANKSVEDLLKKKEIEIND